jgi:hypothetical protein
MYPQILGNLGVFAAATGHQHGLTATAQAAIRRGLEGQLFQDTTWVIMLL